jgi:DNA polymerase elongation subunit (family B)
MISELRDICFLDIETVGAVADYTQLPDRLKTQWARKASFFKREENQTDEDLFYDRAGIYAEFGKVVCVVVGKLYETESGAMGLKTKAFADTDEARLLTELKDLLDRMEGAIRLCAHNGKEFDFPYLSRRMLVNGIGLPAALNLSGKKPWEIQHLDTLDLWKFGDYKHYTSLDLLATIFNIPTSKGEMDGSRVNHVYYVEKDLPKIAHYCTGDVIAVAQLYLRMKGMPLLDPTLIISSGTVS